MSDPYLQPNGVLRNTLGISDGRILASLEANLTRRRIFQLLKTPLAGNFDLPHLNAIHKHIFQDVYPWAGTIRTIAMRKDDTVFASPDEIASRSNALFDEIAARNSAIGTDRTAVLDIATNTFATLNLAHPYREGNGRAVMTFLDHFARAHGHEFQWEHLQRHELIGNSILSAAGVNAPLKSMLDRILQPAPAITTAQTRSFSPSPKRRMKLT